jgi:MFS family permease
MRSHPLLGSIVVGLGAMVAAMDTSVNIVFKNITGSFGLPQSTIQWVIISYVLFYGSLLTIFGKLGDVRGHLLVFRAGLLLSTITLLLFYWQPGFSFLLLLRIAQGVGAALTFSGTIALATALYNETQRRWQVGMVTSFFSLGSVTGALLGLVVASNDLPWEWVFSLRAPIAVVVLALTPLIQLEHKRVERKIDWFGAVLFILSIGALISALALRILVWSGILTACAILCAIAFFRYESRHPDPVVRSRAFTRNPDLSVSIVIGLGVFLVSFGPMLLLPYHPTLSTYEMSLALIAGLCGTLIGSLIALALSNVVNDKWTSGCGLVLAWAGTFLIGLSITNPSSVINLAAVLLVQGLGVGLFQVAYTDLLASTLPAADRGVAGGLAGLTRTVGFVAGASVLSAIFQSAISPAELGDVGYPDAWLMAFQSTFYYAGLGLLTLLVVAGVLLWPKSAPRT